MPWRAVKWYENLEFGGLLANLRRCRKSRIYSGRQDFSGSAKVIRPLGAVADTAPRQRCGGSWRAVASGALAVRFRNLSQNITPLIVEVYIFKDARFCDKIYVNLILFGGTL